MVRRAAFGAAVLVFAMLAGTLSAQELPAGRGAEVLETRCASCHERDLVTSQRLSAAGWGRELDKMVRWGARLDGTDRETLQPYLAANFGLRPAASHAADTMSPGATTYTRACLACHESDLIDSQRLSPAGWTREVEKMMRWGARLTDADKAPLVDYLVSRQAAR